MTVWAVKYSAQSFKDLPDHCEGTYYVQAQHLEAATAKAKAILLRQTHCGRRCTGLTLVSVAPFVLLGDTEIKWRP